jgi:hypothetical protein
MEKETQTGKPEVKTGRPAKQHKRRQIAAAMCTPLEKKLIEVNAKRAGMTVSEFLRELGFKVRTLPKEVLQFTGRLNNVASNMNQLARKRNSGDELNALERALLNQGVREIHGLVLDIKAYVK